MNQGARSSRERGADNVPRACTSSSDNREARLHLPDLLPLTRGMLATVFTRPKQALSTADAIGVLEATYADEPFVRVLPQGEVPKIASVRGTNFCDIGFKYDGMILQLNYNK